MSYYHLNDRFPFGKHKGSTLRQVVETDPSYISWCLNNVDRFHLTEEVIEELQIINPDFHPNMVQHKLSSYQPYERADYDWERNHNWEEDTFNALTDGQLGDYDDFDGSIDDVLTWLGRD